jgi:tetratricopeptide (TPR) repeat protein
MNADPPEDAPAAGTTASGQRSVAVGGDVRDSTVITGDSNVIYIGPKPVRRHLPWRRLLAGLVVVLVSAAAIFVYYPRPIPTMTGELNVAVAEFGALDARGGAVASTEARGLADSLYESLAGELQQVNQAAASSDPFKIQLQGPSQVGRIEGSTPALRAVEAEKVAAPRKAHLLIYGYLEQHSDATTFVPQFYLRDMQNTPELEGEHDLGRSVAVRSLDDPASQLQLRVDLTRRTRAFAEFVIGLSQFGLDQFAEARVHFTQAANDPQWEEGNGKETLYLFLGYTEGSLNNLAGARTNFQRALAINPEFARAHLATGEVQFQESLGKPEACARDALDVAGIQAAVQMFQRALTAKTQPPRSNVPTWTAFEMGRAYLCLSQADAGNYWADAEREMNIVIGDYTAGNTSAKDIAAEAHSNLGFVNLPPRCDPDRDARYRKAAAEYQAAIDLSPLHPTRQGYFYEMLGFIQSRLGALDEARSAYRNAARTDPANKDHYDQLLQTVEPPPAEKCP